MPASLTKSHACSEVARLGGEKRMNLAGPPSLFVQAIDTWTEDGDGCFLTRHSSAIVVKLCERKRSGGSADGYSAVAGLFSRFYRD